MEYLAQSYIVSKWQSQGIQLVKYLYYKNYLTSH